jgi:excisionase family DNA binding protein
MKQEKAKETETGSATQVYSDKPDKKWFTFDQACEYLHYSASHLYKFTMLREIPYYKPNNRRIFFLIEDLDNWISKNRISSKDEIQTDAEKYLK